MTETLGNSNARALFGVSTIPTDNQIRDVLDAVPPQQVLPMFGRVVVALSERGHQQAFRALDGQWLVALDGTQYHRSNRISCEHCGVTKHRNGPIDCAHSVVTPVIVAPGHCPACCPWSPNSSRRRMTTKNRTARTPPPSAGSANTPSAIGNWM